MNVFSIFKDLIINCSNRENKLEINVNEFFNNTFEEKVELNFPTLFMNIEKEQLEIVRKANLEKFNKLTIEYHLQVLSNEDRKEYDSVLLKHQFQLIEQLNNVEYWMK